MRGRAGGGENGSVGDVGEPGETRCIHESVRADLIRTRDIEKKNQAIARSKCVDERTKHFRSGWDLVR